jgi:2-phosphosulfolactate phosphatase
MIFDQAQFDIRCGWGEDGIREFAPISDVVIIVDVLSFSTCVSIATGRGAGILPYDGDKKGAAEFARSMGAEVAGARGRGRYSLSPATFVDIPTGALVVLPGINGARLSLLTGQVPTFVGCLRNAMAVAEAATRVGQTIAVVPAGERCKRDGTLREAIEDCVGAGAIIRHLQGTLSSDAAAAVDLFGRVEPRLLSLLTACPSGEELISMGFEGDIPLCADVDIDNCAPVLKDGTYTVAEPVA